MKKILVGCYAAIAATLVAGWALVRSLKLSAGPLRLSWSNIVFGHRGCRHVVGIPENTLEAFKYAIDHGCGGIECDVRLTKDGELVSFHDNHVKGKLVDVPDKAQIDQLTLAELKSYRYVEDPTGKVRVPTLEEVVVFCREHRIKILIEVKDLRNIRRSVDKILELYARYPEYMYEQATVISFNPKVLYHIRQRDAKVATGSIYDRDFIRDCIHCDVDAVPLLIHVWPALFDYVLLFLQEWLLPWLLGCSLVCPHYSLYKKKYHQQWKSQGVAMYFWGFKDKTTFTWEFKQPGIFVSTDDKHEGFQ
ncbi:unnamed protein product [Phytomonas sp. EM1]|nr:unnamed protein product [Phytomonas sp. EM1]|eukprot:CCW62650.1 unnamed protein product [Phytomonas sp. isolate EM1]